MTNEENQEEKKLVTLWVNRKKLKQWDEFAKQIGTNRTAMIHNAVAIYELFIRNQLNGDSKRSIEQQLEQIKLLIENLYERKKLLNKEKENIEQELKATTIEDIPDFDIIADKILKLLENWGSLPEVSITAHLQYPGWIIWTILKKLKTMKKVKIERGEWSLYAN